MKKSLLKISVSLLLVSVIVSLFLTGCKKTENPIKFPMGTFPDSVYNLTGLNSQYDDYNSNLYLIGSSLPIIFSSNRASSGSQFDLIQGNLWFQFDQGSGNFAVGGDMISDLFYTTVAQKASTTGNDFGPYSRFSTGDGYEYLFVTSATASNGLDLFFVRNLPRFGNIAPDVYGPYPVKLVNSASDDAYLSFDSNMDSLYFCSNRNGNFDIFVHGKTSQSPALLDLWLGQAFTASSAVDSVNSTADDKCPFILGNIMVFTSNRPGGLGGYDLYYSVFRNKKWSSPVNMGPKINTAADEYRPLLGYHPDFTNNLMVFSSNRSGGEGGYDLYFTGFTFPEK